MASTELVRNYFQCGQESTAGEDMFGVKFDRNAAEKLVIGGAEQIGVTRHVLN